MDARKVMISHPREPNFSFHVIVRVGGSGSNVMDSSFYVLWPGSKDRLATFLAQD